jgi:hypothetical protein
MCRPVNRGSRARAGAPGGPRPSPPGHRRREAKAPRAEGYAQIDGAVDPALGRSVDGRLEEGFPDPPALGRNAHRHGTAGSRLGEDGDAEVQPFHRYVDLHVQRLARGLPQRVPRRGSQAQAREPVFGQRRVELQRVAVGEPGHHRDGRCRSTRPAAGEGPRCEERERRGPRRCDRGAPTLLRVPPLPVDPPPRRGAARNAEAVRAVRARCCRQLARRGCPRRAGRVGLAAAGTTPRRFHNSGKVFPPSGVRRALQPDDR